MTKLYDSVWQRRGVSWIWDNEVLSRIAITSEIVSIRQFLRFSAKKSFKLPSNSGNTLVVDGLEFCLSSMNPCHSEVWLYEDLKGAILSFQDEFSGDAALIFRIPCGENLLERDITTGCIFWNCTVPYIDKKIEFGRLLWGEGSNQPREIVIKLQGKTIGWFHPRLS